MPRIARQPRRHRPRERPTRPRTPTALLAPRLVHAVGIVLKVHPWISDKHPARRPGDHPRRRRIRHLPRAKNRLLAGKFRAESPVQTEERPCSQTTLPKRVAVFQAAEIEIRPPLLVAVGMQRPPIEPGTGRRQIRTRRKHGTHQARTVSRITHGVNAAPFHLKRTFAWRRPGFARQPLCCTHRPQTLQARPNPRPPSRSTASTGGVAPCCGRSHCS